MTTLSSTSPVVLTADIVCSRGDTASWTLTVTKNGAPVDLTGASLIMAVRRNEASPVLFMRTTAASAGITITNALGGVAAIKLREEDTIQIPNDTRQLFYTVHVHTASGDEWCVARGTLEVDPIAPADDDL